MLRLVVLPQGDVGSTRTQAADGRRMISRIDATLKRLEEECRKAGARVTQQRREVLRVLAATDTHPDAQTVLRRVRKRMPTISFDTVYRTLSFLEEHGLIDRVYTTGERARFDGNVTPHHHFICTRCGRIFDFESSELDRMAFPAAITAIGHPASKELQVLGTCNACEEHKDENHE